MRCGKPCQQTVGEYLDRSAETGREGTEVMVVRELCAGEGQPSFKYCLFFLLPALFFLQLFFFSVTLSYPPFFPLFLSPGFIFLSINFFNTIFIVIKYI